MSLERSMCWSTSSRITRHWHKCSMPQGQAVDCWLLCRNSVICGARATNTQCINGATAALNCVEKSRAPGSKSSESLLSIRCYFRLWFGRVCNKNAIRICNAGANLEISPPLNKTLESILKLERLLIEKGVSFPVGGSLLLIGRRPLSPS